MKTYLFVTVLGFIIIQNTSCVHYYYAPGTNNVPLFKEKGEARLQAQYSVVGASADFSSSIDGFEIQTAYAVGNHTAVQLNFFNAHQLIIH